MPCLDLDEVVEVGGCACPILFVACDYRKSHFCSLCASLFGSLCVCKRTRAELTSETRQAEMQTVSVLRIQLAHLDPTLSFVCDESWLCKK